MSETIVVPDNGSNNNGWNSPLGYLAMGGNNGGFLGGNGLGAGVVGFILGALINNNGNGLFGNGGNNNGAAAASLGAQATANANAEMVMNAINGTDADVRLLATTLNSDMDSVRLAINTVQGAVAQVGNTVGMTGLQVINAIQSGNTELANKLCQCCCDMKQLVSNQGYENQIRTLELGNAMNNGFAGVNTNIAATKAAQELSDCKQTYTLTDTMNRNYLALDNKLDAMESSRKDREITALTAKVAQLESQNFTTGVIAQAVGPINAQLAALAREVDDIKCKQPSTVSVQYPNLVAVNTTPYVSGGFYQGGMGYNGNGFGNPILF